MMLSVNACGVGLASDLTPEELGNGVWSDALNVRSITATQSALKAL